MRCLFVREAESRKTTADAVLLIVWFAINATIVRFFCSDAEGDSSFWSANAAMVAALLMFRPVPASLILAACLGINVDLNLCKPWSLPTNVLYAALNVLQAAIAAFAARRLCGATTDLTRLRRLATFGMIALGSAVLETTVGAISAPLLLGDPWLTRWDWAQWIFCDGLGMLLAMPVTVILVRSGLRRPALRMASRARNVAAASFGLLTAIVAMFAFVGRDTPLFLFLFPCLSWLATQLSPSAILLAVFAVSVCASVMTSHGLGPIAALSPDGQLLGCALLQPFLIALLLTVFPVNVMLAERARSERRLRLIEAWLRHSSTHDPLTHLMNRWLFGREMAAMLRTGRRIALIFLDIDHFKQINDSLGHGAGDHLLQAFAARLLEIARARGGRAARFGGDEFVLMIPVETLSACQTLCGDLLATLRLPYDVLDRRVVTVSMGVAVSTIERDGDQLMQSADKALYAAKAAGRNGFHIASPTDDAPPYRPGGLSDMRLGTSGLLSVS